MTGFVWGTPDLIDYGARVVRGSHYSQLMHMVDWYPTLLEAAGIDVRDLGLNYSLDGVSQWRGIVGNVSSSGGYNTDFRDTMYYGLTTVPYLMYDAVQYQGYKLVNTSGGGPSGWYPPMNATNHGDRVSYEMMMQEYNEATVSTNLSWLLFDLVSDPTEHFDVSNENPDLVQQMRDIMVAFEESGVPQNLPDPECPKQTFVKDPTVGNVYFPWCEGYP